MKKALYFIVPLLIIIILYFIFFGRKKSNVQTRISQINTTLQNQLLSSEQVQSLLTEKYILQNS